MKTEEFEFNEYKAIVILPEQPNGKWIWKTEFLYAFDQAEQDLSKLGYTRVYYQISDKYGSCEAIKLMHTFHLFVINKYNLEIKTNLFGFSRGGLYAYNYSLFYPEYVSKIYLDAPVLDVKSWPRKNSNEYYQLLNEYHLNEETYKTFLNSPINHLKEFFKNNIPLLVIAGDSDEVVPFEKNSKILLDYAKANCIEVKCIIKPKCGHHPHSLEDVKPIIDFINN